MPMHNPRQYPPQTFPSEGFGGVQSGFFWTLPVMAWKELMLPWAPWHQTPMCLLPALEGARDSRLSMLVVSSGRGPSNQTSAALPAWEPGSPDSQRLPQAEQQGASPRSLRTEGSKAKGMRILKDALCSFHFTPCFAG